MDVSRCTIIVCMGKHLLLTCIERFFSTVCSLFSYTCWSATCLSWVSKFHKFFVTCSETEARFIFEGIRYYPSWKVHFQLSGTSLDFFTWSVNYSRDFFCHFFQSVNCMSWVSESCNISRRCPEAQALICYFVFETL